MTKLKPTICAVLLTISISSTALAGNIPTRTSNSTGNIPTRKGNIPTRTSNSTGNIPTRTGIIPTRFDFSESFGRMFQLLLDSGVLF